MKTLLIDCPFLCHQAKHTLRDMRYADQGTGVIFGFLKRLIKLAKDFDRPRFIFCWDSKKSWRKIAYSDYKANRQDKTPEQEALDAEAYPQFQLLRTEILPRIGFRNVFMQVGLESDDLMAWWAMEGSLRQPLIMVTGDEDMYQCLIDADFYSPAKKLYVTEEDLHQEYGCTPPQWAEAKRIAGCDTDNVQGVVGVGTKTAIKFLKGEMKEGSKTHMKIVSPVGKHIAERNEELVVLPHPKTKPMEHQEDEFSVKEFGRVLREYGIRSLLGDDVLAECKRLFHG